MPEKFQLTLTAELAQRIRDHGAETFPHECCGALLGRDLAFDPQGEGPGREVVELFRLVNRRDDSPHNRFALSAEDVLQAEKAALQQNLDVVGWYHSHPDHPARPSQFDREHAWPWYSYIIVSVMAGAPAEMTSWRLNDDRQDYSPERIEVQNVRAV